MTATTDRPESPYFVLSHSNLVYGLGWARLGLLAIIYTSLLLVQILQGFFVHLEVWQTLNVFMIGAFALQIPVAEAKTQDIREKLLKGVLVYDLVMFMGLMAVTGSNHSVFLFLFLVYMASAGLVFGRIWSLKLALFAIVALNMLFAASSAFEPHNLKGAALLSGVSMLIIVGLSGLLGDQIQYVGVELESKEQEIQALTDLNRIIVDNIPSGILMLTRQFKIVKVNRGANRLFEDLALEGRQLEDVFPALQSHLDALAGQNGKSFARVELDYRNLRDEKLIFEAIIASIRDNLEQGPRWIVLLQNMTEIRHLEMAMRQKEKLAAVGQLAAGIAHEIRNPLASISGSVQLLSGNLQSQTEEDKKLLSIVIREIDRLNNLITEFLDFVRPDVKLDDPVDVNAMLREILEMVKNNKAIPKNTEHQVQLEAQRIILGHYDKLKQALINIIINAYQAMGDTLHPLLSIRTFDREDHVVISIKDNGIGMTPETIRRIFEPFHTTKPKGTGLGLAITHKIIESHEGTIKVESELGHGTTMELSFPAARNPKSGQFDLKKKV